jgi:hypothetical protein
MFRLKKRTKVAVAALVVCVASVGAYAFTASNTFTDPTQSAGIGGIAVAGYQIDSPTDTKFSADNQNIVGVTFALDHVASDVKVAFTNDAPASTDASKWQDCGASASSTPFTVTCDFTQAGETPYLASDGTYLSVAAVEHGQVSIK